MQAKIKAISYYLPEHILDNQQLNEMFPEWSVDKISAKTGIFQRHIAAHGESCSDMAIKVSEKLFEEHNISRESIDFILLCTQSPDFFLPTTACIVQHKLGIPTRAGALDYNQGCSGYIYGLSLSKALIFGGMAKNVLLLTSEAYSKFIHPKDKSNRTIFGDAATATLVSGLEGFVSLADFVLGTDGRGAENLIVKHGAMRFPAKESVDEDRIDEFGNVLNDANLYMNGSEIFNFTSQAVPQLIKDVIAKNELTDEDVALFIFHQANKYMLNHLRKKIQIPEDRFFYFLENCGNTVSSSIPIALLEAVKQNKIKGNTLLAGFGVGYSWGGCILKPS